MKKRIMLVWLTLLVGPAAYSASNAPTHVVKLAAGAVIRDCAECPEVVVIPGGRLQMGHDGGEQDRYEGPVRQVTIDYSFAAGRYPVTNREYARFVEASGYQSGLGCRFFDKKRNDMVEGPAQSWREPGHGFPIQDDEPVVCVSWLDSQAYVAWLSARTGQRYRLLAEAEWEYLARDGANTAYPWGDDVDQGCRHANIGDVSKFDAGFVGPHANCKDGFIAMAPVNAFPANRFGIHDLIGNSWEWVADCYVVPYPASPSDGSAVQAKGACDRRSVRGGAWITAPYRQRSSWRGRDPETHKTFIFGFRVARDLS